MTRKRPKLKNRAQTAIELAVFGAIFIFVLGLIVRTGLSNAANQNQALRAMRMAMRLSFEHSEGLVGATPCNGDASACAAGVASHNSTSVLLVEDRLSAEGGKYGTIGRTPIIMSSGVTHSRNLLMPIDPGETWNIPMSDIIINGQHFPFAAAGFGSTTSANYVTKVPNHPEIPEWNPACSTISNPANPLHNNCWDLDCDGNPDVANINFSGAGSLKSNFAWQWGNVQAGAIQAGTAADFDGDCQEEQAIVVDNVIQYLDFQLGDIDPATILPSGLTPGIQQDLNMYSEIRSSGTFLKIDQSAAVVTTEQRKETVDLVERVIVLTRNTGRFCQGSSAPATVVGTNIKNPVEACNDDCTQSWNITHTCYDLNDNIIYVRSRVYDIHGRKWQTDISGDPTVTFTP